MIFHSFFSNDKNYYYYNGLILPLYPVLCCFKRDFYSVSRGSRDISVLLSLFQYLFISVFTYLFQFLFISVSIYFSIYYLFIFISSSFLFHSFTASHFELHITESFTLLSVLQHFELHITKSFTLLKINWSFTLLKSFTLLSVSHYLMLYIT